MGADHVDFSRGLGVLRPPCWRFEAAQQEPIRFGGGQFAEDQLVTQLRRYLAAAGRDGEESAAAAFPLLARAVGLERDAATRRKLVVMVVAGVAADDIARRMKLPSDAVASWEQIFFDARPACDLSVGFESLIRREREAGNRELAAEMRLAREAGLEGVEAILACDRPPLAEAERLAQRRILLERKLAIVLEMPLTTESAGCRIVQATVKLLIAEKKFELDRARLVARCGALREQALAREARREERLARQKQRGERARRSPRRTKQDRAAARAVAREVAVHRQRAEAMARAARIAASPLSELRWAVPGEEISPSLLRPPRQRQAG